ncbi:MAG TPA: hypothetical protein VH593_30790 [Ktedonobacteraceae bacterium]|jgi:hypothetical protein
MESQAAQHKGRYQSLLQQYTAFIPLFLLSMLFAACGATTQAAPTNPVPTTTIHLQGQNGTPTPMLPGYTCGAWATNTSPTYSGAPIAVYAKYTQNVDGNPQGIGGATATATVYWGDGSVDSLAAITTADGLAVFSLNDIGKVGAINQTSLVTVNFTKDGTPGCNVDRDRAAFFTLTLNIATATPTTTATPPPPQNQ